MILYFNFLIPVRKLVHSNDHCAKHPLTGQNQNTIGTKFPMAE